MTGLGLCKILSDIRKWRILENLFCKSAITFISLQLPNIRAGFANDPLKNAETNAEAEERQDGTPVEPIRRQHPTSPDVVAQATTRNVKGVRKAGRRFRKRLIKTIIV